MPLATDSSEVILNRPICEERLRCVPPQNSIALAWSVLFEVSSEPIEITRTGSGYFSPKTARTPEIFCASASGMTVAVTGSSARIRSLQSLSISESWSAVTAWLCEKSNLSLSGPTTLPACLICSPSTCRSAQFKTCVPVWFRIVSSRERSTMAVTVSPQAILPASTLPT